MSHRQDRGVHMCGAQGECRPNGNPSRLCKATYRHSGVLGAMFSIVYYGSPSAGLPA
jgi:hypothetical protein